MKIYTTIRSRKGLYGGANSFLKTLFAELERRGVEFTNEIKKADLCFLNALTWGDSGVGMKPELLEEIWRSGLPVVHRKTGFWGRGSKEFHSLNENGVIHGDQLQLDFSDKISFHVFQSDYSLKGFQESGFKDDNFAVIHNGVDQRVFSLAPYGWKDSKKKNIWQKGEVFRLIICSWSPNYNKGFELYKKLDDELSHIKDVEAIFIGRMPADLNFKNIKKLKAMDKKKLSQKLKESHVFLQMSENDTCSNALIEGLSCGLPSIYLNSGGNTELAKDYGVAYSGNWKADIEKVKDGYLRYTQELAKFPYSIEKVADKYIEVFQNVLNQK